MLHLDLFSGIGGFALATEMVWQDVEHVFCDNDLFCQAILKKHWPNSKIYGDIRELITDTEGGRERRSKQERAGTGQPQVQTGNGDRAFILTGGFPCQPFSQAGRRKGTEDDRYLWPEMFAVIRNTQPEWVIAENVGGLITWNNGLAFEQVCTDLESEGYEVQPFIIPAVALNAPHRRDRVWIVAHARHGSRRSEPEQQQKEWAKKYGGSNEASGEPWTSDWAEVAARLCRLDDGLPNGLPRPRGWRNAALKAYGNAIVPQVAAEIMRAINH